MQQQSFYNQSNKMKFFQSIKKVADDGITIKDSFANTLFMKMSVIEERFDTDFGCFNESQTLAFIREVMGGYGSSYTYHAISILRSYITWCYKNGVITAEQSLEHFINSYTDSSTLSPESAKLVLDNNLYEKYRNSMVGSQEEFISFCEAYFSHEQYTMQRAAACLCWLNFSIDEIANLRITDFDSSSRTIKGVPLEDDYFFNAIKAAAVSTGYQAPRGDWYAYHTYIESSYLIRTSKSPQKTNADLNEDGPSLSADTTVRKLSTVESKIAKTMDPNNPFVSKRLSVTTIRRSSRFCKLYQMELEQGEKIITNQMLEKIFPESNATLIRVDYTKWCRCFHS